MKVNLWNYSDSSVALAEAVYHQKTLMRKFVSEFTMEEYSVEMIKNQWQRYLIKVSCNMINHNQYFYSLFLYPQA